MKVLITGICGFVGTTLAKTLAETSSISQIVGIDSFRRRGSELNRKPLERLGVSVVTGDIRSNSDVEGLPAVDWLIDAAAVCSVTAGIDGIVSSRQVVEHNLIATINLLEHCKRSRAGFILLSTSRVYSIPPLASLPVEEINGAFAPQIGRRLPAGVSPDGIDEMFSTAPPISLYGSAKLASEQLALEYGATFDFPVWINRCGVLAGAGQFGHPSQGIFAFWIHSFREGRPLSYIGFSGSGHQVRDCLHPKDLVPLLLQQFREPLSSECPRTINLGGGLTNSMSLRQLTSWCEQRYEPVLIQAIPDSRRFDVPWLVLDSRLANKTWNWRPETSIESVLDEIATHADEHPNWLDRCC
jgi:CDP-paratose 2-epimerase